MQKKKYIYVIRCSVCDVPRGLVETTKLICLVKRSLTRGETRHIMSLWHPLVEKREK